MSEPEDRRLAWRTAAESARGEVVKRGEIVLDVDVWMVLERDEQGAAREVRVVDLPRGEFAELLSRHGGVD